MQKALLLKVQFLLRKQTKTRTIKRIIHRSRLYQDHSYIDRKMSFLISSLFIFRRKCKSIFVCKFFARCVDLSLSLQFKIFLFVIWMCFEKLVVINYFVVSKEMICLINRRRRRNSWSLKILLKNNWERLKDWQRDEVQSRTLTKCSLSLINRWFSIIKKRSLTEKRNVCRRMNLAFILVTLTVNLIVAFEVYILLSLHKS